MIALKTKDWQIDDIEAVLFDKDGTFIDLHYFWGRMTELRSKKIIELYGLNPDILPLLCLKLGYDINSSKMLSDGITAMYSRQKIIEIFSKDLLEFGIEITHAQLAKIFDDVSEEFYKNMFEYTLPIGSAIDFIKKLKKKNIKTAVVTSDSIISTKLTLEHFGWQNLFDFSVGRESSPKTKESGALVEIVLQELNLNPKKTIMIGDAPMDFFAAKNAGVKRTILVSTGQISKEKLLETSPYVVENLSEIEII